MICCGLCARNLKPCGRRFKAGQTARPLLPYGEDYCTHCARPVSERAVRKVPAEAFVAFVRATRPRREAAWSVKPGHDSRKPPLRPEAVA